MFEDFDSALIDDQFKRRRNCGFTRWVLTLEPEDQAKAVEIVEDRRHNCRALARYFQSKGATFNDQVLNRHRNRSCCGQARDV